MTLDINLWPKHTHTQTQNLGLHSNRVLQTLFLDWDLVSMTWSQPLDRKRLYQITQVLSRKTESLESIWGELDLSKTLRGEGHFPPKTVWLCFIEVNWLLDVKGGRSAGAICWDTLISTAGMPFEGLKFLCRLGVKQGFEKNVQFEILSKRVHTAWSLL